MKIKISSPLQNLVAKEPVLLLQGDTVWVRFEANGTPDAILTLWHGWDDINALSFMKATMANPQKTPAQWTDKHHGITYFGLKIADDINVEDIADRPSADILHTWLSPTPSKAHTDAFTGFVEGFVSFRRLFSWMSADDFRPISAIKALLHWHDTQRFCRICQSPTTALKNELAAQCVQCGTVVYPTISPAVLCVVVRPAEILLVHGRRFPPNYLTAIAGFVELGESLEECVHREVAEEVHMRLAEPTYFGSQYWPFPHQMMTAFWARYQSGDGHFVPNDEIESLQWLSVESMNASAPKPYLLPPALTLSRQLIEHAKKMALTLR